MFWFMAGEKSHICFVISHNRPPLKKKCAAWYKKINLFLTHFKITFAPIILEYE